MNASTDHQDQGSQDQDHEATEALQHIADEVEHERAERGRSDVDQLHLTDGEALADALASSQKRPDVPTDTGDDDAPDADTTVGLAEHGTGGVIPVQNGMKNPH